MLVKNFENAAGQGIEVHWTSQHLEEARRISRLLVQERLVACAQIVPQIESIYRWDDQVNTSQETQVILKTRQEHYDKIKEIIEQNCSYAVPQIIWFKIEGGNRAYLEWLQAASSPKA